MAVCLKMAETMKSWLVVILLGGQAWRLAACGGAAARLKAAWCVACVGILVIRRAVIGVSL